MKLFQGFRTAFSGPSARRPVAFFLVAALLGVPAAAARILCFGDSCALTAQASSSDTPFCSLPDPIRIAIARGFYEGRSPDIMAVTGSSAIVGGSAFGTGEAQPRWPAITQERSGRVPVIFSGYGVDRGLELESVGLKDIAETAADIIGSERPNPDVRAGRIIEGVATGETPRLVVEVVWKGVGSDVFESEPAAWPTLGRLLEEGVGTFDGSVGSLPADPAAVIATIGTGGYPSEHGVIGSITRNNFDGRLVKTWGRGFPGSVIAALGDHLDEELKEKPVIGLVGTDRVDRGLVGGTWYPDGDEDLVRILGPSSSLSDQAAAAERLLEAGALGSDPTPDLVGVVFSGPSVSGFDRGLERVVDAAAKAADGSLAVIVTTTGGMDVEGVDTMFADELEKLVEDDVRGDSSIIEATAPGGLYADQDALGRLKMSDDELLRSVLGLRSDDGSRLFADAFPSIAVSFARYC